MAQFRDLTDQQFGRLTCLGVAGRDSRGHILWRVRCSCESGKTGLVITSDLTRTTNPRRSCGCLQRDIARASWTVHGKYYAHRKTYRIWRAMLARCQDPKAVSYHNYGERGIRVCAAWQSFASFLADMGDAPDGCSLDRKDNDGGYAPENCRWATRKQQARNTRTNRLLTFQGETRCLSEWAELRGLNKATLNKRLALGWSVEVALRTPVGVRSKFDQVITFGGS